MTGNQLEGRQADLGHHLAEGPTSCGNRSRTPDALFGWRCPIPLLSKAMLWAASKNRGPIRRFGSFRNRGPGVNE